MFIKAPLGSWVRLGEGDTVMTEEDLGIVRHFKEKLLESGVPVIEARVYGSRARGDFTGESDLDVCLVVKEMNPDLERTVSRVAWEVGFEKERVITTVEYTPEQIERSPLRESPFIKAIQREGVAV